MLDLRPTPDLYRSVLDRLTVAGGPAMTDGKMGSALFAMKRLQGMYALSPQADHLDYFITVRGVTFGDAYVDIVGGTIKLLKVI